MPKFSFCSLSLYFFGTSYLFYFVFSVADELDCIFLLLNISNSYHLTGLIVVCYSRIWNRKKLIFLVSDLNYFYSSTLQKFG